MTEDRKFDYELLKADIPHIVRALDNVIDRTEYPLAQQMFESHNKRRMGLGFTGLANALTLMGIRYGTPDAIKFVRKVAKTLAYTAIEASSDLALEKGSFKLFDADKYLESGYVKRLPQDLKNKIKKNGMRNSHLTSIAPTGSISFGADNISGGIEPVFSHEVLRTVQTPYGPQHVMLKDYVWNYYGIKGETTADLTTADHLAMQMAVAPYIDSAVSKTINVGDHVTYQEFKDIYMKAYKGKLKGVTTFRLAGKRYGILNAVEEKKEEAEEGGACFYDPETGTKSCDG